MMAHDKEKTAHQRKVWRTAFGLRLLVAVSVVGFLYGAATPTFAQTYMGSSARYSDVWLNDSNQNAPRIEGAGVTDDAYNSFGHKYWVQATLTSPNGRKATLTTSQYVSYARAIVSLAWDWNDMGTYTISSIHYMSCPYAGYGTFSTTTTDFLAAGLSYVQYENPYVQTVFGVRDCVWRRPANCGATCVSDTVSFRWPPPCPYYARQVRGFVEGIGYRMCVPIIHSTEVSNQPGPLTCCDGKYGTGGGSFQCNP